MPAYSQLPSFFQWQRDSWIQLARRKDDSILTRIDNLVNALNRTASDGESHYLYGELYFATNYWLKSILLGGNPALQKGREAAIRALCRFTIAKLAEAFRVPIQSLPNELEKFYGKGLSEHGVHQDHNVLGTQHYMDRAQTNKFRIFFRQGLAYQFPFRPPKPNLELVNSSSWSSYTNDGGRKIIMTLVDPITHLEHQEMVCVLDPEWAYYVMSMSRDIYMGPHMTIVGEVAMVHSSWLAGTPVQSAGSMLIEDGVVKGIRNNSGHYKPSDEHMLNVLELLRTVGVDLTKVDVHDYAGHAFDLNGKQFLEENGNWDSILKRSKWKTDKPIRTVAFQTPPGTTAPGPTKKKYRCPVCGKIYESGRPPVYCQYCHMSCVAV